MALSIPRNANNWIADNVTENWVDVYFDVTGEPSEQFWSTEWELALPSGIYNQMTLTQAILPDTNNPSQNPDDFFYDLLMDPFENYVDSTVDSGLLTDNVRVTDFLEDGAQNVYGLGGSYAFTIDSSVTGTYNFTLGAVTFESFTGTWDVNNENLSTQDNSFTIVPEPSTFYELAIFAAIVVGGYHVRRRRRILR